MTDRLTELRSMLPQGCGWSISVIAWGQGEGAKSQDEIAMTCIDNGHIFAVRGDALKTVALGLATQCRRSGVSTRVVCAEFWESVAEAGVLAAPKEG